MSLNLNTQTSSPFSAPLNNEKQSQINLDSIDIPTSQTIKSNKNQTNDSSIGVGNVATSSSSILVVKSLNSNSIDENNFVKKKTKKRDRSSSTDTKNPITNINVVGLSLNMNNNDAQQPQPQPQLQHQQHQQTRSQSNSMPFTSQIQNAQNSTTTNSNSNTVSNNSVSTNNSNASSTNQNNISNQQQQQKKEKQRPETWNKIEQQIFFNALRQNGKNFESITQYFNARQKKYKDESGNVNIQRSKEQIRHFYYRTWHKIIKYISLPTLKDKITNQSNDVSAVAATTTTTATANNTNSEANTIISNCSLRDTQVKCLIAFNVLMNKSQRWNKKTALKLVELINQGWTTVREKGKITRLRMPLCKISSKSIASELETNVSLPLTINVKLEPKSEHAYCRVHRLAQNPFLSVEIQMLQSVKYLIEFLENKWKNRRNQFLEKFHIENEPITTKHQTRQDNMPQSNTNQEQQTQTTKEAEEIIETGTGGSNQSNNGVFVGIKRLHIANESYNFNMANFSEKLILYPNESHQIINLDLFEQPLSSDVQQQQHQQKENVIKQPTSSSADAEPETSANNRAKLSNDIYDTMMALSPSGRSHQQCSSSNAISKHTDKLTNKLMQQDIFLEDETMMVDKFELISSKAKKSAKPNPITPLSSSLPSSNNNSSNQTNNKNSRTFFQLQADQLRAGLTSDTTQIQSSSNKEIKELKFVQLYLALNKPDVIRLKYDWVTTTAITKPSTNLQTNNSSSIFSLVSSQNQQQRFYLDTLANVAASFLNEIQISKNHLSSTNNSSNDSNCVVSMTGTGSGKSNLTSGSSSMNNPSSHGHHQNQSTSTHQFIQKSPPKASLTSTSITSNQLAIIQPNSHNNTTTILPLDTVLQRLSEEQTNKTKKLLSDLNSKRRSRQRKPIMVVNSSNQPRNILLPKLNLVNGQQLVLNTINMDLNVNNQINLSPQSSHASNPSSSSNSTNLANSNLNETIGGSSQVQSIQQQQPQPPQQQPQQNIVLSGPVAAVARQIVNNVSPNVSLLSPSSSLLPINLSNQTSNNNNNDNLNVAHLDGQQFQQKQIFPNNNQHSLSTNNNNNNNNENLYLSANISYQTSQQQQSCKIIMPSFHQAYSNLIPQILNNLIDTGSNNNDELNNDIQNTKDCENQLLNRNNNKNEENLNVASPQTLADMSLLDLSINNSDSLFGQAANCPAVVSNIFSCRNNGNNTLTLSTSKSIMNNDANNQRETIQINSENAELIGPFSGVSSRSFCQPANKISKTSLNEQNANSNLTGLGDSIVSNSLNPLNQLGILRSSSSTNINADQTSGYTSNAKRSDIIVEWTDSMNDVSLTGLLNDLQSPEKPSKNSNLAHVLNENSRDSIFFNMDTIMDILPTSTNRYDESSLINNLNTNTSNNNVAS